MLHSLKKILKEDPEILAYTMLGHNLAKIAHLAQKGIFGEIPLK